jgi:anthranilate synthase component 1
MVSPVYLEAKKIADAGEYRTLPVSRELYADSLTPLTALRRLKNVSKHVFLLESVEKSRRWERYTFLGFDPAMELTCLNGSLTVRAGSAVTMDTSDPSAVIRQVLRDNKSQEVSQKNL